MSRSGWGGYRGIADGLRQAIADGEYSPGDRLPGEGPLAAAFGVARMTMRRALAELEKDGTVRVSMGRGRFVGPPPPPAAIVPVPPTRTQEVEAALRDALAAGEWHPGARLPSEAALAATYGVARATVRSALARLVKEGLIVTRQGVGSVVQPLPQSGGDTDVTDAQPATAAFLQTLAAAAAGIAGASASWKGGSDEEFWLHLARGALDGLAQPAGPPSGRAQQWAAQMAEGPFLSAGATIGYFETEDTPQVLLVGDPVDGFAYYGPFLPGDLADEAIERAFGNETWWYVPLRPLPGLAPPAGAPATPEETDGHP